MCAGLIMADNVGAFLIENCMTSDEVCEWAYANYGSATRASWTMFKSTFSGGWPFSADRLVWEIDGWYAVFWFLYVVVVWFGAIRVVSAIFIKQTMEIAHNDQDYVAAQKIAMKARYSAKLRALFQTVDENSDGLISRKELDVALANPLTRPWLQMLEIDAHDTRQLFDMLDDGDGEISFDEFLGSALRLKGWARSIDSFTIMRNLNKIMRAVEGQHRQPRSVLAGSARAPVPGPGMLG